MVVVRRRKEEFKSGRNILARYIGSKCRQCRRACDGIGKERQVKRMKLGIAADHGGYELKEQLINKEIKKI